MVDNKKNQITFSREELTQLVETCESARIKLFKNIEVNFISAGCQVGLDV